eukprot:453133-Prymnesium_polylepis.1
MENHLYRGPYLAASRGLSPLTASASLTRHGLSRTARSQTRGLAAVRGLPRTFADVRGLAAVRGRSR